MSEDKASIMFCPDVKIWDRDSSYVDKEALAQHLDLQQWQIQHIKTGVADADAGRFVDEAEVEAFLDKYGPMSTIGGDQQLHLLSGTFRRDCPLYRGWGDLGNG